MVNSVRRTAARVPEVRLAVDADDPCLAEYEALARPGIEVVVNAERTGYAPSLNSVAAAAWDDFTILGAFGDDVLFQTPGWDRLVEEAMHTPAIVYGNDLVHAAGHPTAIFMASAMAKALGWLAIPQSRHLWVDDAWKALGQATGTLRYIPEAIFEHMHPVVGKAEMDQTYHEVYDGVLGHQDHLGFLDWQANHLEADAEKVRGILPNYDYAAPRGE
jgi:hypothetical protein